MSQSAQKQTSKRKSLSASIYLVMLGLTLAVIFVFSLLTTGIYYFTLEDEAEDDLLELAQAAAALLDRTPSEENIPILENQLSDQVRYTLIDADGTVLYDSAGEASSMESHADRPEFQSALESGAGVISRYSDTAETVTVYAAVELEDGSIIRLAETRETLLTYASGLIIPETISFALAAVAVLIVSRILTRRIVQ
ncbi:MAG: two-component sensor histidine kinase, partial [Eggerthellaceae bacterium]|nr:two-component sensor histidine kinase [Eggerthellaceae bacterium]